MAGGAEAGRKVVTLWRSGDNASTLKLDEESRARGRAEAARARSPARQKRIRSGRRNEEKRKRRSADPSVCSFAYERRCFVKFKEFFAKGWQLGGVACRRGAA